MDNDYEKKKSFTGYYVESVNTGKVTAYRDLCGTLVKTGFGSSLPSNGMSESVYYADVSSYGQHYTLYDINAPANYTFVGIDADCGSLMSGRDDTWLWDASSDITITFRYGANFTVRFEANGGTGEMDGIFRVFGAGSHKPQDALPMCAFARQGKVFAGWNTAEDGSGTAIADGAEIDEAFNGVVTEGGQSVVLYAQWRDHNIVVTKADVEGGADVSSVGTLQLFSASDGYVSPVAQEGADHVLRFEGEVDGKYRVSCLMDGKSATDFAWESRGVKFGSLYRLEYDIDFTGGTLNTAVEYGFAKKPLYRVEVKSPHGTVSVSPSEDSAGGMYIKGRTLAFAVTPDAGYAVSRVSFVDLDSYLVSEATIADGTVILSGILSNVRLVVDYKVVDYALSASVDGPSEVAFEQVSVTLGGKEAESGNIGDVAVFSATLKTGYSFGGWYDASGAKVSDAIRYEAVVQGDIALSARARASVSFGIEYDGEGDETCSVEVDGAPYELGTAIGVTLGDSLSYRLVLGERTGGVPWKFDCWMDGETVLPSQESGILSPTGSVSMTAMVAASVSRTLKVYLAYIDEGQGATRLEDAEKSPDAVVCSDATAEAFGSGPVLAGSGNERPFTFTFDRTKVVRLTAALSVQFLMEDAEGLFRCFSTVAPGDGVSTIPEDSVLTRSTDLTLMLNTAERTLYAYYGGASVVRTSVAYASLSDSTMGTIAVVATDPADEQAAIADDGMSAMATQGKTLTLLATPVNGYRFAGWYDTSMATGNAVSGDARVVISVRSERTLYAKFTQDTNAICEWEGEPVPKAVVWRSKTYESSRPFCPSACRVDALGYVGDGKGTLLELEVGMFSAPNAAATSKARLVNIASQDARRLPVLRPERYVQVEVKANVEIDAVAVGTSMGGLAQ